MISIVGIDPSLTHTAGFHALGVVPDAVELRGFSVTSTPKGHAHPLARLASIRDRLRHELELCAECASPGLAFIEGYAFGAKCAREALGEWGGQVRLLAFELGWSVVIVPPSTLKAYVCGKGNAPKELVMLNVFKKWAYEAPGNDEADAYALMQLGLAYARWRAGEACSKALAELLAKLTPWEAARAA